VLGMALSIEFGIANTYALGMCCYVVCALMIVISRQANRLKVPAARSADEPGSLGQEDVVPETIAIAPSIQPAQTESLADVPTHKPLEATVPPTVPTRAN
jgi:hypothetical protein